MTNNVKTWIYLLALTSIAMFLGAHWGGRQGLLVAFVLAFIMNFVSYFYSDKIVLRSYGARLVEGVDPYGLQTVVSDLARKANIPKPAVYIIPSDTPNAFATGRSPRHASVAATEGILKLLSREEIEGVLAHELSHVEHRDTFIMAVVATLGSMIMYVANAYKWATFLGGPKHVNGNDEENGAGGLIVAILSPFAAMIIQLTISRGREFMADESGAALTSNPRALASALWKIHNYAQAVPMATVNPATAHLFIVNPLWGGRFNTLFTTHPPVEERIKRLIGRTL